MKLKHKIIILLLLGISSIICNAQVKDPRVDSENKRLIFDSQEHLGAFIKPYTADDADETLFENKVSALESKGFQSLLNISELEAALENGTATVPDGADIEEDLYIGDDFFGALLNKKREIVIGGDLFKYESDGAYIFSDPNINLDALLTDIDITDINLNTLQTARINDNMVYELSNQIRFFPYDYKNSIQYEENYDIDGAGEPAFATGDTYGPSYELKQCKVDKSGFFESFIKGSSETCISQIADRKRIKTKFSNQNYLVYSSVYIKTKTQKKRKIIGDWYKSRFCDYIELGRTIVFKYPVEFPSPPNLNHNFLIKENKYNRVINQYGQTVSTNVYGTTNLFEKFPFDDASFNYQIYYYIGTYNPTPKDINKLIEDGVESLAKSLGKTFDQLFEGSDPVKIGMTIDTPDGVYMAEYGRRTRKYGGSIIRKTFDWNVAVSFSTTMENFFGGLVKDIGLNTFTNAKTYDVSVLNFYGLAKYNGQIYGGQIIQGDLQASNPNFIDSDGDGVPDKDDLCIYQKGQKRFNGCPFATIQNQALYTNRISAQGTDFDLDADSNGRSKKRFGACFNMNLKTADYPFINRKISGSYNTDVDIIAGNKINIKGASGLVIKPSSNRTSINFRIIETPCSFRANGASKAKIDVASASDGTSKEAIKVTKKISTYPNPTKGNISIDLGDIVNNALIKIHALDGRQVFTQTLSGHNKVVLDLSKNAKGIYFISVITPEKTYSSKILKE